MKKIENANNLMKGNKIIKIETTYDFKGNVVKEYMHELEVVRVNKKTVEVKDNTYNMNYKLIKDYQFGKLNCGIRNEYYIA